MRSKKQPVVSSMLCGCRTWWGKHGHVFKYEACPWCCLMRLTECPVVWYSEYARSVSAENGQGGQSNAKNSSKLLFS